ncbi:hypothetical protein TSUD_85950 [Trifolium subterraneum]|uniref:Uncharacterized protein n=1 Tax=Trifolium subterraneum TaxID=3900 RepID=A0A2Z6NXA6_TRISU|nr:hypothetical protein TSUD_85950 [Trifolium subterraneum]
MAKPLLSNNSDNLFRDSNVEESQGEDKTVADPNLEINTKMDTKDISIESTPVFSDNKKNSQSDFLQTLISTTHNSMLDFQVTLYPANCLRNCLTELETTTQMFAKLSKPTSNHWLIAPPPEPLDIVASPLLNLSLWLMGTECFTENQCHDIVAYRLLPSTLQIFDQMSKSPVTVWVAFPTIECTNNGHDFVDFDLFKGMNMMCIVPGHYTLFNMMSLCHLDFWYCGRHAHFVDEKTMHYILELKVRKHPDKYNYEDGVDINGYRCCPYSISGTLTCGDRCPASYHSMCIGVMASWFLHNSYEVVNFDMINF